MNLAQFITFVKDTAIRSPFINQTIDGDVYQINSIENQYGIFCITPMSVEVNDNSMAINSTLFYIDRLTEDESNINQIQSDGVTALKTIIEEVQAEQEIELENNVTYTIFKYKFTDECAGVFAEVTLNVSNDDCEESYLDPIPSGESVIEVIKQNGIILPIVDKTVNIDAYTRANVDSKLLGINTAIEDINGNLSTLNTFKGEVEIALPTLVEDFSQAIGGLDSRLTPVETKLSGYTVQNFTVRYNPKFDTLHRPTNLDRAPLLLNRSKIETVNGKRFFNIDIVYNNFIPGTSPSTGFEQDEILFLFPRMAGTNYSDYTSLLDSQFAPYHTPTELYELNQYYVVGWINRINAVNYSTGNVNSIGCTISKLGEVINNTNAFFKSTTATLDRVYQITGRYEIASDWTVEEYNNYVFE